MEIKIVQLDRTADTGGVITAHWTASKTDGELIDEDSQVFQASAYGAEKFIPNPDSPDFVPFNDLTEADVISWLKGADGWLAELTSRLDAEIAHQKNPPVLQGLPWEQNDEMPESE